MSETGLPQNENGAFSTIYPELFSTSPGAQLTEITVSPFGVELGRIRVQSRSDRKERYSKINTGLFPASPAAQLQQMAVSRSSSGPAAANHRQHFSFFSIRSGIVNVFDPVGSPKC